MTEVLAEMPTTGRPVPATADRGRVIAKLRTGPGASVATGFLAVLLIVAACAKLIEPFNPAQQNLLHPFEHPSWSHWLGTDQYGRDLLSRLISGAQVSLGVSVTTVLAATVIALPLGLV